MTDFLHGVQVVEITNGVQTVRTASSSVIGVIGTAPEAKDEDFPINTPVLIAGSQTEAAKLGKTGTLPEVLNGILSQASASVVVVRVEDIEVAEDAEEGAPTTETNILGDVTADGNYTGVNAFLIAKNKLGISPRILIAPGFCSVAVVIKLISIANRLRAIVVADTPTSSENEALEFVKTCADARVYAVYPDIINSDKTVVPASPYVAGVISRTDNTDGFWVSPSNKTISGIIGLGKAVDFTLGDGACKANYLNENKIATIINQNGYRVWGNRSTAAEGAYQFLCVRRTADIISESILRSHLWTVDRNIVKNYLTEVSENVNAFLASLKSQGAILAGKCFPNKELNTAANIAEGKVFFDFEFTPAYPAEQVTFRAYLNNDDVESILLENLA